eukprot:scaffold49250_cov19-Cyclotella_meneghiniana.AAC.1
MTHDTPDVMNRHRLGSERLVGASVISDVLGSCVESKLQLQPFFFTPSLLSRLNLSPLATRNSQLSTTNHPS